MSYTVRNAIEDRELRYWVKGRLLNRHWWRWRLRAKGTGWLTWATTYVTSGGYGYEPPEPEYLAPPLRRLVDTLRYGPDFWALGKDGDGW